MGADVTIVTPRTATVDAASEGLLAGETLTVVPGITIAPPAGGEGIFSNVGSALIINNGTITVQGASARGIRSFSGSVTNNGEIVTNGAFARGILMVSGSATNNGTIITFGDSAYGMSTGNGALTNTGTIVTHGATAHGMSTNSIFFSTINTGTIIVDGAGSNGIHVNFGSHVLTIGGSITSLQGDAIHFTSSGNKLTLLPDSQIVGGIALGTGTTVTIEPGGQSMLLNFTGQLTSLTVEGGQPYAQNGSQIAILAPQSLGSLRDTANDTATGISSTVLSHLMDARPSSQGSASMLFSYAHPDGQNAENIIADNGQTRGHLWTDMFAGYTRQRATVEHSQSTRRLAGLLVGIDREIAPGFLMSGAVGGLAGREDYKVDARRVNVSGAFAAAYGWYNMPAFHTEFGVSAGFLQHRSQRQVANNLVLTGGADTLSAQYGGAFVDARLMVGRDFQLGASTFITPSIGVAATSSWTGGYSEAGSAAALSVAAQQDHSMRGWVELALSHEWQDFSSSIRVGAARQYALDDRSVVAGLLDSRIALPANDNQHQTTLSIGGDLAFKLDEMRTLKLSGDLFHSSNDNIAANLRARIMMAF